MKITMSLELEAGFQLTAMESPISLELEATRFQPNKPETGSEQPTNLVTKTVSSCTEDHFEELGTN